MRPKREFASKGKPSPEKPDAEVKMAPPPPRKRGSATVGTRQQQAAVLRVHAPRVWSPLRARASACARLRERATPRAVPPCPPPCRSPPCHSHCSVSCPQAHLRVCQREADEVRATLEDVEEQQDMKEQFEALQAQVNSGQTWQLTRPKGGSGSGARKLQWGHRWDQSHKVGYAIGYSSRHPKSGSESTV